jgi:hypothetical protein
MKKNCCVRFRRNGMKDGRNGMKDALMILAKRVGHLETENRRQGRTLAEQKITIQELESLQNFLYNENKELMLDINDLEEDKKALEFALDGCTG